MMQKKPIIVCLMGPTASGKTQLAVHLTQQFPFEIISVDSAMIYRGMDIGTAKPGSDILRIAPHRLINIRDPHEAYSAAQFRTDALHEILEILKQGKIPLLVGGTMLYFRALQKGIAAMPSADTECRTQLTEEAQQLGWPALHKELQAIDPEAADRIHPHDSQRIQRALEVYRLSGKSLSEWQKQQAKEAEQFETINIVVAPEDRAILHERIVIRFKQMLAEGLVDEVKRLYARGDLNLTMPAIRSVGYRQVWEYLQGKYSYEEMCEKGIIATRQLAKRQLTWLRSWPNTAWFDSSGDFLGQAVKYLHSTFLTIQGLV